MQGRDLEAETEGEAMEEHDLLACASWLAQPGFLDNSESPALGWHCLPTSRVGSPTSTPHQEDALQSCLQGIWWNHFVI